MSHIFQKVGDLVYTFSSDNPRYKDGKYPVSLIGHEASMDTNTDSAVFLIRGWVDNEDLRLPPEYGLKEPTVNIVSPLEDGSTLIEYAASRCSAIVGVISGSWIESRDGRKSMRIFFSYHRMTRHPIKGDGDYGTIFLDENGIPRYFHHVLVCDSRTTPFNYKSMGVPFRKVVESHPGFLMDRSVKPAKYTPVKYSTNKTFDVFVQAKGFDAVIVDLGVKREGIEVDNSSDDVKQNLVLCTCATFNST
jgi:hypothetical protein